MRFIAAAFALVVFIVNPGFGCGDDFAFGPAEMKSAAEGTWELSFESDSAPRAIVTLQHSASYPSWSALPSAHACGNRSFMSSASACLSSTGMTFDVETVKAEEPFARATGAGLGVIGQSFSQGTLSVQFSNTVRVDLELLPDGTVVGSRLTPQNRSPELSGGLRAVRRR
jgi:hypothetical protein